MDYNQISKEETNVVGMSEAGPSTGEVNEVEKVETTDVPMVIQVPEKDEDAKIQITETEETKTDEKQIIGMVQVKTHKLYLRKSANDKSERVTMLSKGDVLEVDEKLPGWYSAITEDGKRGFVMKEYVEVV